MRKGLLFYSLLALDHDETENLCNQGLTDPLGLTVLLIFQNPQALENWTQQSMYTMIILKIHACI